MPTITIPIYVERIDDAEGGKPYFRAAPLFFGGYERRDAREDRALERLAADLRREANSLARDPRHDALAAWAFYPEMKASRVRVRLNLRRHWAEADFFFAVIESLGRRIAVCPHLPGLPFEIGRGESLASRASEVFTEHFRKREKLGDEAKPEEFAAGGSARIAPVTITANAPQRIAAPEKKAHALIFGEAEVSGAEELERTGRCLDRGFPNDLPRAILREAEVAGLAAHLGARDAAAPCVLIGPPQVGKTAVISEVVWGRAEARRDRSADREHTWLLSPQRLISGMSYIGQWEERFLAILKHARKRRHILYFDDLLGLFQSGKSSSSNLSMGDLLKAAIEEGGLRLVAEATPEAWARLQESQRGFTELFRIERLAEPDDAGTLRILSRCAQALEAERGCRFEPGAVPLAADLARRYMRGTAFPGKAAELLRQLAAGADGGAVGEAQVYAMFERRTGIGPRFLDPAHGMDRGEAEAFFHRRIAAQDEAVAAMADAAVLAKAQLDDPGRPVASLLFLGPTGVGKTECAKALAEFFFGSPERLTRFDMNEFSGPDAALRLIGVLGGAQGQLTGALRRNPYSVVLLDEIEKAHPEVFDLLLQVLGEGRLTDANGFSANFCNAIIVLTSNLGARSARRKLGFGPGGGANAAAYREAAEKFFRPELFNRIDRIIPFAELERDAIEWLARGLAQRALGRLGVVRRRLMLQIDPGVYPSLADAGYDPKYGARALRRAVEERLVEPLALEIAALHGGGPGVVRVGVDGAGAIELSRSEFRAARRVAVAPAPCSPDAAEAVAAGVNAMLAKLDERLGAWDLEGEGVALSPLRSYYYRLREDMAALRRRRDALLQMAEDERPQPLPVGAHRPAAKPGRRTPRLYCPDPDSAALLAGVHRSAAPAQWFADRIEEAYTPDALTHAANRLTQAANRLAFLSLPEYATPQRALIGFTGTAEFLSEGGIDALSREHPEMVERYGAFVKALLRYLRGEPFGDAAILCRDARGRIRREDDLGSRMESWSCVAFENRAFYVEGHALGELLALDWGTHLFYRHDGAVATCEPIAVTVEEGEPFETAFAELKAATAQAGRSPGNVVRLHGQGGYLLDLQTGILTQNPLEPLGAFADPLIPPFKSLLSDQ